MNDKVELQHELTRGTASGGGERNAFPSWRLVSAFVMVMMVLLAPAAASAMSMQAWLASPVAEQGRFVADSIATMTDAIAQSDPDLARNIRDWFSRKPEGKETSEGMMAFGVEVAALQELSAQGKIDLSKIKVEGVLKKIVRDKFQSK